MEITLYGTKQRSILNCLRQQTTRTGGQEVVIIRRVCGVFGNATELAGKVRPSLLKSITRAGEAALVSQLTQYGTGLKDDFNFKAIIEAMALTGVTVGFTQRVMKEDWQQRLFNNTFGSVMQQTLNGGVDPNLLAIQVLGTAAGSAFANTAKSLAIANGTYNIDYTKGRQANQGGNNLSKTMARNGNSTSSSTLSPYIRKPQNSALNTTNHNNNKVPSSYKGNGGSTSTRSDQSYVNALKQFKANAIQDPTELNVNTGMNAFADDPMTQSWLRNPSNINSNSPQHSGVYNTLKAINDSEAINTVVQMQQATVVGFNDAFTFTPRDVSRLGFWNKAGYYGGVVLGDVAAIMSGEVFAETGLVLYGAARSAAQSFNKMGFWKGSTGETLFRLSGDLNEGIAPITNDLVNAMRQKGRSVDIALKGSDDYIYLKSMGAEGSTNTAMPNHILIREDASKSTLIEEFLHGTQQKLGIVNRLTPQGAEVHVKDFMIRHSSLLGLNNPAELRLLEQLKIEEIERLSLQQTMGLAKWI